MNINFNHLLHSVSLFKEKWLSRLTPQQKKIMAIASIALSALAAGYLLLRCCFYQGRETVHLVESKKAEGDANKIVSQGEHQKDVFKDKDTICEVTPPSR